MQIVFLPIEEDNKEKAFTVKTYNGFSFAGLKVDAFFESEIASYVQEAFSFLTPEEILEIKAVRLGPQGFFYHNSQKIFGIALFINAQIKAKISTIMKAEPISELWSQATPDVRPLLQSVLDSDIYEACRDEVAAFALDRILDSGGMTAAQMAEEFGIPVKSASAGLFALATKGFVQCWERAGRIFKITDLGLAELEQVGWTPVNNSNNSEVLSDISDESIEELLKLNTNVHLNETKLKNQDKSKSALENAMSDIFSTWSNYMIGILILKTTRANPEMAKFGISKHKVTALLDKVSIAFSVKRKDALAFIQTESFRTALENYRAASPHPDLISWWVVREPSDYDDEENIYFGD